MSAYDPSDILKIVEKNRTLFEKILAVFPGYRGYKQKELLRETDKLVRDVVWRNMKENSDRVRTLYREALSIFGLSQEVRQLERLSMRGDTIAEKIRHAEYGYAPFMNIIKVDENALIKLIEFDAGLADSIQELKEKIKKVEEDLSVNKLLSENIKKIDDTLKMIEDVFDKRSETLVGIIGG
jgi:predicted transcriptional regulator